MKILEIKKTKFKREVFFCGHRLLSFLRLWNILETIMKDIDWLVSYRSFRQRGIELPADCHLDWSARNELVDVRVGDLKRFWVSGEVPLEETPLVRYLRTGDETVVRESYELLSQLGGLAKETVEIGVAQSRKVFDSVRGLEYDPARCCIVINEHNVIIDGYHRSSAVLAKHGPDYKIRVLRLLTDLR